MLKRLLSLEKIRRFTLLSIAVSIFAFCINLVLFVLQRPELYYLTILLVALADTILLIFFNVINEAKETLKRITRMKTAIFLSIILLAISVFLYLSGLTTSSVLLSICVAAPVFGGYLYFATYYIRLEKLRTLNRAIQRAGHN